MRKTKKNRLYQNFNIGLPTGYKWLPFLLRLSPILDSGDPIPLEGGKLFIFMNPLGEKSEVVTSVDKRIQVN